LRDGDATHPCGLGGFDSVDCIFDYDTFGWQKAKFGSGGEKNVRSRLFVDDFFAGDDGVPGFRWKSDLTQVGFDLEAIGAGGNCNAQASGATVANQIGCAGKCAKLFGDCSR